MISLMSIIHARNTRIHIYVRWATSSFRIFFWLIDIFILFVHLFFFFFLILAQGQYDFVISTLDYFCMAINESVDEWVMNVKKYTNLNGLETFMWLWIYTYTALSWVYCVYAASLYFECPKSMSEWLCLSGGDKSDTDMLNLRIVLVSK